MMSISTYGAPRSCARRAAETLSIRMMSALRAIRSWHENRTAIRHLGSLSDSHLKDIGLHRSQIEFAVHVGEVRWAGRCSV